MRDRIPANPGRMLITPESGAEPYYATVSRADNPTQDGTPINKNTLLKDSTAKLLNMDVDGVPDEAIRRLAEGKASNENLLDNPRFELNQRGATSLSVNGASYFIADRWAFSGMGKVTRNSDNSLEIEVNGTDFAALGQSLELNSNTGGKTATFSFMLSDGSVYSVIGVIPTSTELNIYYIPVNGKEWQVLYRGFGTHWSVALRSKIAQTVTVKAAKLELGSVQTLAHQDTNGNWVLNDPPPDKGVETLKCATSTADSTDTFANMGAGATKTISSTLTTSWTASGNYFYQDVAVSGLLVTDTPIVGIAPGSDNAANVNYSMAFSNVFRITTSANGIRAWARSKPTVAIPIQIKVVR